MAKLPQFIFGNLCFGTILNAIMYHMCECPAEFRRNITEFFNSAGIKLRNCLKFRGIPLNTEFSKIRIEPKLFLGDKHSAANRSPASRLLDLSRPGWEWSESRRRKTRETMEILVDPWPDYHWHGAALYSRPIRQSK